MTVPPMGAGDGPYGNDQLTFLVLDNFLTFLAKIQILLCNTDLIYMSSIANYDQII